MNETRLSNLFGKTINCLDNTLSAVYS